MHERGRNSAATRDATTSVFAARIEMPVVLRGGLLNDQPALVPAGLTASSRRVPRRFGTFGWMAATALCALSVYAVRDTMFAPLAQSDAPSSAWETRTGPGDTAPPLTSTRGSTHIDLDDHDASPTGTTIADVDSAGPSVTGSGAHASETTAAEQTSPSSASVPGGDNTPGSTADSVTSSTPSTSTPDTLDGHGANSGSGKGGSGPGSGSP